MNNSKILRGSVGNIYMKENANKKLDKWLNSEMGLIKNQKEQCVCWSKYGKSLNSGIKCSNCGREL